MMQISDTTRLRWLMQEVDGLCNVRLDRYAYAAMVAEEEGREEPNDQDMLDGFRRMIDLAIEGGDR